VIGPTDSESNDLTTLLRFLDLQPVHVRNLAELRQSSLRDMDCLAVIAGYDTITLELLAELRAMRQPLPVVCISREGLPKIASSSGDLAWFHLDLPVKQRRLSAVLDQAQKVRNGHPTQPGAHRFRPSGTSRAMRAVHRLIEQVAPFDTNVLILGESGTGKEMVARHIHELSERCGHPFVPVNCGAIPADLLESELFGHEKGAFTGALSTRLGRFEFAEGGTLFLDEIGDMSTSLQTRLLRVLSDGFFYRVGGHQPLKADVRIIAATHQNLEDRVKLGQFREDLYHRLSVVPIRVPPLSERREDIPELIDYFMDQISIATGLPKRQIGQDAMAVLQSHIWPGNVRQLRNNVERVMILAGGGPEVIITADMLPQDVGSMVPAMPTSNNGEHIMGLPLREAREVFERDYLIAQISRFSGNISRTAEFVGMERSALHRKLKALGVG
jgi:two-component system nitrogen regulation response regulator NtrX